ncbi:MAG: T9SS type A sorting domain-containing protein [Prolixibacteraceae bacterium]
MKSIIYIFLFSFCFSLHSYSQNYKSMIMENWSNDNWVNSMRYTNTFDNNGNILTSEMDMWNDTTKVWDKQTLTNNTLNANGTVKTAITQSWDIDDTWSDIQKSEFTYDDSKNVLTQKIQINFGGWMDYSETINTYNNGKIQSRTSRSLDFLSGQMVNSFQVTYTYNADGTENQEIFKQWNENLVAWENSSRSTNAYNSSKLVTSVLSEDFNNGEWVNNMNSIISYNNDKSVQEALGQDWQSEGNKWVDSWKETNSYNPNGTLYQTLNMVWNMEQNRWENESRITFMYNAVSFIQSELADNDLIVFPNPFTKDITIAGKNTDNCDIQLYTVNGQLIRTFLKDESLSGINLAALKTGTYYIRVSSPEFKKMVKIIKLK